MKEMFDDVASASYEDCCKIIEAAIFTPVGRLFNEDSALSRSLNYLSVTPGAQGEGRFGVVPVPTKLDDGRIVLMFPPPADVLSAFPGGRGLAITDDAACTPPAIQAAQLDFTQRRRIGSHFMGALVRTLGATNSVEDSAGGWEIPRAWENRMGWIKWPDPPAELWARYLQMEADAGDGEHVFGLPMMLDGPPGGSKSSFLYSLAAKWFARDESGRVAAEEEEARVLREWPEAWSAAAMRVAGFVKSNPTALRRQPKDGQVGHAWASPRTVEMAARAYASSAVHGLTEDQRGAFIASFVGRAWANEFDNYCREADLPNTREFLVSVLKREPIFRHNVGRLDRTMVVINSCAALVCEPKTKDREELARGLFIWLKENQDKIADLIPPIIPALVKAKLTRSLEATEMLASIHAVTTAANR